MVWGCITPWGVGRIHRINGIMTVAKYVKILDKYLLGTLSDYHKRPSSIVFQHDRDSKHMAHLTADWLDRHSISVLPWTANSPDLNIIENIWDLLDRRVHSRDVLPRNTEELWVALQEESSAKRAFAPELPFAQDRQ